MAPPRLTIETFGGITTRIIPSGHFEARTRYRNWDGQVRLVQATADTAMAAERALKVKITKRHRVQPGESSLTPDSLFSDLVNCWLEDIDLEERISRTTRNLSERNMRTLVLSAFGHLTLREIGVARCDRFIKQMAKRSYNRAKQARVVLRLAIELAVRHEVLPSNPMDHVSRLYREPHIPDALSASELNAIRAAISRWEAGADHSSGPRPDGQLGAIVEVMLGTSARIGEVLAIRLSDVDVAGAVPSIRLVGTIVSRKGRDHLPPGSTEDRKVETGRGPAVVRVRRGAPPPRDRSHH